ncbi:serine hydrolase domain-containing protein [Ramlibacter algicola]|uniref:Serine hydrolase n=1 Tax=Ramlibacter algicola TaxID=2795217 RepID=A0A934PYL0_9BURK|nr:serine hydrolase [Ramlibacter algicola]MBK0391768.1 serine hydrolase [Ramlibacter algicola]
MAGTLTFDGRTYPDGRASDPKALGWMQGSPPPADRRIEFGKQALLGFPQIRWTLCHTREFLPTVNVWRGDGGPSTFAREDLAGDIEALAFDDLQGRRMQWQDALADTYTDGIVVLHRGRIVYERYIGELQAHVPHSCFSVTKSYACTLAAMLVHEGVVDERRPIAHWLPEMRGTAWEDATLRQVMDMQVGAAYSEAYADSAADVWAYSRAGGTMARPPGYDGPGNFYEYLATIRKDGAHGEAISYKTVNTEVLCWVMKRATGLSLARMLSERLWAPLGCEQDAYFTVDPIGVPMGGGGMSAALRDLARFGEAMRCDGAFNGKQVVPAAVVADIARGSDPAKFAKAGYALLPGYSYRSMWWVAHDEHGTFEARGIHGQRIYVAPGAEMVIARFGSHPVAANSGNDPITLAQFRALAGLLRGR